MKKKKILFIFGTRPEAIKLVSLLKSFNESPQFEVNVCVSAQHREMLDQVLEVFDVVPDFDLDMMEENQNLYSVTSKIISNLKSIIEASSPDYVFVHGDTTTTFASSLAAFYHQVSVCHVEAGLRTYKKYHPFPEEMNRQLVSKLSSVHFCPTETSKINLINEGVSEKDILISGNTVIDTLFLGLEILNKKSSEDIKSKINSKLGFNVEKRQFILITAHRRENFGEGFENICNAILTLAKKYHDIDFIYPVHLNPNVQQPVKKYLSKQKNVHLIPPQEYLEFLYLMSNSYLIITDSGGIQEEAPSLGKPVFVLRDETERPEAVEAGTVKLVGTDREKIINSVSEAINNEDQYYEMSKSINPYGDGKASEYILDFMKKRGDNE